MRLRSLVVPLLFLPLIASSPAKADPVIYFGGVYPNDVVVPFLYDLVDVSGPPTYHVGDTVTLTGVAPKELLAGNEDGFFSYAYTIPDTLVATAIQTFTLSEIVPGCSCYQIFHLVYPPYVSQIGEIAYSFPSDLKIPDGYVLGPVPIPASPVPEPSSLALLLSGAPGLGEVVRRRARRPRGGPLS